LVLVARDWSSFGGTSNDDAQDVAPAKGTDWSRFGGTGVSNKPWEQGVGWQAGGQMGSTANAFDNEFYDKWNQDIEKAQKENQLLDLYDKNRKFTGIVTRDDAKHGVKFGDVYRDGEKQFNMLDDADIPRAEAYQMLARVTLSDDELAHAQNQDRLEEMVEDKRRVSENDARKGRSAKAFDDKVQSRQEEFVAGQGDEALIVGASAGGAAAALGIAATAAAATGVGLPVAALLGIGALGVGIGATGGLMNKDLLSENAARQQILIEEANRRKDGAGVAQFLRSFGEVYGQSIQPATNIVMGGQDLIAGGGKWNNESDWYATDPETGESLRHGFWDAARFGAGAVDAFGSSAGAGRIAYVGSIGASLLGQGTQLGYQGEIFNDRSGEFQSIYTNEQGEADPFRAASAWGAFGIDAVQSLGVQGMLSSSIRRGQGTTGLANERVTAGGRSFTLDADGRATGRAGFDVSFLAPSEAFRGVTAASLLRLKNRGNVVTADELYRAVRNIENKAGAGWGATLTTGLAEGYEEGVQALLNQWATGEEFDLDEIVSGATQGLSAGLGMGAAGALMARGGDKRLRDQANAARVVTARPDEMDALKPISDEEWSNMTDTQKRVAANLNTVETAAMQTALGNVSLQQAKTILLKDPAAQQRLDIARIALSEAEMRNAAPNTKSYMRITAFEDTKIPGDKVQASFARVGELIEDQRVALELMARGGAADQQIDPETVQMAGEAVAELDQLVPWMQNQMVAFSRSNRRERAFIMDQINAVLDHWGSGTPVDTNLSLPENLVTTDPALALSRAYAVSINFARDPIDQNISFQLLVPTVSQTMTEMNANQTIQVSYSILDAIGGDFDGDRIRSVQRLATSPAEFRRARSGQRSLMSDRTSAIAERHFEEAWLDNYRQAAQSQQMQDLLLRTRANVRFAIRDQVDADPILQQYISQAFAQIETGSKTAIKDFVTAVMKDTRIAPRLLAKGADGLFNVPERLNRLFSNAMADFSQRLSVVTAPDPIVYDVKDPIPMKQGGPVIRERRAVTAGRTMFQESPAAQIFRIFQELRYSPLRTPVEARHLVDREEPLLADLQALYLQIGQGEVESVVEAAYADSEVNARVIAWTQQMSDESARQGERIPVAVLASMAVPHFGQDGRFDGYVTLTQSLLERSIAIDESKYGPLISGDPNLQARFTKLREMTKPPRSDSKAPVHKKRAGAAFVYVYGQMSVRDLTEVHGSILNDQATIDELYRSYRDQDYHGRHSWMKSAKTSGQYPEFIREGDLPYTEETALSAGVSPYRVLIDSIEEAGNFDLSVDENGNPTGIVARQSGQVSTDMQAIVTEIQEGISLAALPENRELTLENLQLFLAQNPQISQAVIGLAAYDPKMAAVFADLNAANPRMAPWLYEALLLPPKTAELNILMNTAILSYRALDIAPQEVSDLDDDPTGHVRDYEKLDDRFHQLFFKLAAADRSGMRIAQLFRDVESITNRGGGVDEFIRLLNNKYRGNQAPFVAWYRDVASFDASAMMRFGAPVAGTEQRKSISELKMATAGIAQTIQKEREAQAAVTDLLAKAREERRQGVETQNGPRMALREAIEFVRKFEIGTGPNEMIDSLTASLETFFAKAADKGVGPDEFAPAAALEVMFHEFAINYSRVDTSTGTIDLDTVIRNPSILLRGPITIMDNSGNEFEWLPEDPSLTDEDAIEDRILTQIEDFVLDNWDGTTRADNMPQLSQGVAQSVIRRMLEPSVWQMTADGRGFQQRSLVDDSLAGMLSRDAYSRLYGDNNAPISERDNGSIMEWLALVNSSSGAYGGNVEVQRYLSKYLAHAASSLKSLSPSDAQKLVSQTMHELGFMLQKVGDIVNQYADDDWNLPADETDPDGRPVDILTSARLSARAERSDRWLRSRFGSSLPDGTTREIVDQWMLQEINALTSAAVSQNLRDTWMKAVQDQDDAAARVAMDQIQSALSDKSIQDKVSEAQFVRDVYLNKEPVKALIEMYGYPPSGDGDAAAARRTLLSNYVKTLGTDLTNRARWADASIHRVANATGRMIGRREDPGTTAASEEDWNAVSRAVISYELIRLAGQQGASEISASEFPKLEYKGDGELTDELKNWDPSQQYVFDDLLDIKSPMVRAAAYISRQSRRDNDVTIGDLGRTLDTGLGDEYRLRQWTIFIPPTAKEASDRFDSNAAQYLVAMAGQPQDVVGIAAATPSDPDIGKVAQVGGLDANLVSVSLASEKGNTPPLTVGDLVFGNPFRLRLNTSRVVGGKVTAGTMMPLANLHGRFVKTFKVGGVEYPMEHIAVFHEASQYWVLDLDRAREVFKHMPRSTVIEMEIVTQAEKIVIKDDTVTGLAHSQYFDGVIDPVTDIDSPRSLIGAQLSAAGGSGRMEQQNALQAAKKGLRALLRADLFSRRERAVMETRWATDLSYVLHLKAMGVAQKGKNLVENDWRFYNSFYKTEEVRHFVASEEGLWSAERVIQWQRENPGLPITDEKGLGPTARLVVPPQAKLRAMYGDFGPSARTLPNGQVWTGDPADIPVFDGVTTARLIEQIPGVFNKTKLNLLGTEFGARRPFTKYSGTRFMDYEKVKERANRLVVRDQKRARLDADRQTSLTFNAAEVSKPGIDLLNKSIRLSPIFDWRRYGIPIDAKTDPGTQFMAARAAADLTASMNRDGRKVVLEFREVDTSRTPGDGVLTAATWGDTRVPGLEAGPGDLLVVDVDSWTDEQLNTIAFRRLEQFMESGADIFLATTESTTNLGILSRYIQQSQRYEQIPGSPNHFRERDYAQPRSADMEALATTLTSTNPISGENKTLLFHGFNVDMDENTAKVKDPEYFKSREVAIVTNIVPSRTYPGFALPKTAKTQTQVVRKVAELTINRPDWMTDSEHRAVTRLNDKYNKMRGGGEFPSGELRKGDFIPQVKAKPNGEIQIYFHRYKHKDVPWSQVQDQLEKQDGIARTTKSVDANFTGFEGEVTNLEASTKHGARVRLRVSLGVLGDKKQVALAGMKYTISSGTGYTPTTRLTPDRDIDLESDYASLSGKNAWQGTMYNHRSAIVAFGWDMRGKLLEAFREATGNVDMTDAQLRQILQDFSRRAEKLPASYLREIISDRGQLANIMSNNGSPVDFNQPGPLAGYVEATLVYLMGAETAGPGDNPVNHIMGPFGGLVQGPSFMGATGQELPRLFTEYFDSLPPTHETRKDIIATMQQKLGRDKNGYYILNPDFTITAVTLKNGKIVRSETGRLQIAEVNSTGDNPTFDRFAEDSAGKYEDWSPHTAALSTTALGTTLARSKDLLSSIFRTVTAEQVPEITQAGKSGASILDTMMDIGSTTDNGAYRWSMDTPSQEWYRQVSRNLGWAYRVPVDPAKWAYPDDEAGKQTDRERKWDEGVKEILSVLHLKENQSSLVHYWVRQTIGQFGDKDPESKDGDVTFDLAMQALADITFNVKANVLPVVDADVPMLHRDDLAAIFEANRSHPKPWLLREGVDIHTPVLQSKTVIPSDWSGFVHVALGVAETGQRNFDAMNLTAVDGLLQSYALGEDALRGLPISRSDLVEAKLWDPQTSRIVMSIDPRKNAYAKEPSILDPATATLSTMFGVQRQGSRWQGARNLSPERRRRDQYRARYRRERGLSTPVETGVRNFRQTGAQYVNESTTKNGVVLAVHDLRHFTTLFNPFLWLGAGVEMTVRNVQDDLIGTLMGTATGGASRLNPINWSKEGQLRLAQFANTRKALAENPAFASMMYGDMQFKDPHIRRNFVTKFTGFLGRSGDWMQDPTYGQPQNTMARRYVEAVLDSFSSTPGVEVSEAALLYNLEKDPQYVKKNFADAHRSATARVANMRSLKMTSLGLLLRSVYEIPGSSQNGGVRMFGDLFLKTPLMYSGYLANVATNMLGLNTANNLILMYLNGRRAGKFARRALGEAYTKDGIIDLSSMIDTLDLTRSMVADGISVSSLFMAAAFAGSTGMASGEDEEERRRRKAMQYQGGGIIYDPRQIENDWRSSESLYLDQWPALAQLLQVAETGGVPHWIIKQFTSPFLGVARAVETGNMEHIKWGFQDVLGSMPLFNETMAIEASQTFDMLTAQADEEQYKGTDSASMKALGFLTKAVMAYESMVLESSFANMIYQQADKYDRDPFVIPEKMADGSYVRDRMDVPRPTRALEDFYDPETGELLSAYAGRDWFQSTTAGFTENRATFAFLMSLGTGLQGSQYWRNNMVAKTRTIDKEEMSLDNAASLAMGLFQSQGFADDLTRLENGEGIDQSWLLSTYAEDGSEELTTLGAEAVIRGVWNGSVKLGDKSLEGLYIPYEMREQLQDMFLDQFTQEGVDLGLSQEDAVKRAKLIGYGPYNDSSVPGLFDAIWTDELSYVKSNRYYQLNTTYVNGPDGKPWATAVQRNTFLGAMSFLTPYYNDETGRGLPTDQVLNSVDYGSNLNTGLRALEKTDESWVIPTPEEIGESIEKAIEKLGNKNFTQSPTYDQYSGYGRRGYGGGGGGGGGRNYANNSLMPFLNGMKAPYLDNIPQLYINNINPRRSDIRRERFSSERGRLNQWQ
jgi:hypothetical protein